MSIILTAKNEYTQRIEEDIWPYWEAYDDAELGGILNCINNNGDTLISDRKFTWSQGRYLWLMAELLDMDNKGIFSRFDAVDIRDKLKRCRAFVMEHAFSPDGECYYLLTRHGQPLAEPRTGKLCASVFSDCFVLIGLANAQRVMKDKVSVEIIKNVYHSIVRRIRSGNFLTEPYPIPQGYRCHSTPMILMNVSCEYAKSLEENSEEWLFAKSVALECVNEIFKYHYDTQRGVIREFVSTPLKYETHLQDRHIYPGHTLESIWFIQEACEMFGDAEERLPLLCSMAKRAWSLGWDEEHGGLLRFLDKKGGPPKGLRTGETFEQLIVDTWSMKLWWPHAEALYTLLKLYSLSKDTELLSMYQQTANYVFSTFPDTKNGEWIQIRDRAGNPEEKLVALPVKDPFHILRAYCLIAQIPQNISVSSCDGS